jgi:hypothetical protein
MASITLRTVKGSPLSNQEMDDNFNNINVQLSAALPASSYTAADVLTKLKTVDGTGSGLDADLLDGYSTASAATANTIALRDANGDLFAGTFWGTSFQGNLVGNVTGNVTGSLTGNATNVSGTVAIVNGGTGGSDAASARSNLGLGTIATQAANNVSITGGNISGLTTDLALTDGGTGASNAAGARTNLGLSIGSDVQAYSSELATLAGVSSTGFYVRTGAAAVSQRSIAVGTNGLTVTNANGVSGNPTISLPVDASLTLGSLSITTSLAVGTTATFTGAVTLPSITKSGTNGTGDIGQTGNRFGTIYGVASTAQYADLAEKYLADATYETGTVMVVGGEQEITKSNFGDKAIGVVSAAPAYCMNDELVGGTKVALKGRVPVKVTGAITKGKSITAGINGTAVECEHHFYGAFGVALESSSDEDVKLVECVIL